MSYGVGCRHGLDPAVLWRWCRPTATAPIGPPAWEPPHAVGVALGKAKRQKKKKKKEEVVNTANTQNIDDHKLNCS